MHIDNRALLMITVITGSRNRQPKPYSFTVPPRIRDARAEFTLSFPIIRAGSVGMCRIRSDLFGYVRADCLYRLGIVGNRCELASLPDRVIGGNCR